MFEQLLYYTGWFSVLLGLLLGLYSYSTKAERELAELGKPLHYGALILGWMIISHHAFSDLKGIVMLSSILGLSIGFTIISNVVARIAAPKLRKISKAKRFN